MSEPLVIIGKGMAATRLVDELSKVALGRYSIAIVGDEPRRAYNRVLLSSLLANEIGASDIDLKPEQWWRDRGVTMLYGQRVAKVDLHARAATLVDGVTLPFGKLVFATGSDAIRLPLPGLDLPGVMTFRTFEDVDRMRDGARAGKRVVVIGGGLLGLEAAHGLAKAGATVTVIHLMDRLMERQLDPAAAAMLRAELGRRGIDVILNASTRSIDGVSCVAGVTLADGRHIPADLVVMAVGIRANAHLAKQAGVLVNRGIVVDDHMRADIDGVHALGECAEHRGVVYGLVEPAYEQARVLARTLAGLEAVYSGSAMATNLKVSGVKVFSAGDFLGETGTRSLILRDRARDVYKKLVIRETADGTSILAGCVLYGDTTDGPWYFELMRKGSPIDSIRDDLIFGRAPINLAAA